MTTGRRQFLAGSAALLACSAFPMHTWAVSNIMIVHKDPNCGCCHLWAEAMQKAGFDVMLDDVDDLAPIKARLRVPGNLEGCHTAEIEGYFLEGHVPLASVLRMLKERPAILGLAVPGMPFGSLGMGDDLNASFDVIAVSASGYSVFDEVRPKG